MENALLQAFHEKLPDVIVGVLLAAFTTLISLGVAAMQSKAALRRRICVTWKLTEQEYDRSFHKQVTNVKIYEIVPIILILCTFIFAYYHYSSIFTDQHYKCKVYILKYGIYTLKMTFSILFLWMTPIVIVIGNTLCHWLFTKGEERRNDVEAFVSRVSEVFLSITLIILPLIFFPLFVIGIFMYLDGEILGPYAIILATAILICMVYVIGIKFPREQFEFHRYYYANILDIDPSLCGVITPSLEKSNVKIGVLSEDETRWKCVSAKLCSPYKERSNTKKIKEIVYIAIFIVVYNPPIIYYICTYIFGGYELRNVLTNPEVCKGWLFLISSYIIFFAISMCMLLKKNEEPRKLVRYKVNPNNVFYLPKDQFKDKVTSLDYQLCIADENS